MIKLSDKAITRLFMCVSGATPKPFGNLDQEVSVGTGEIPQEESDYWDSEEFRSTTIPYAVKSETDQLLVKAQQVLQLINNYGPEILGESKDELTYILSEFINNLSDSSARLTQSAEDFRQSIPRAVSF
jgi:hypothetical protein